MVCACWFVHASKLECLPALCPRCSNSAVPAGGVRFGHAGSRGGRPTQAAAVGSVAWRRRAAGVCGGERLILCRIHLCTVQHQVTLAVHAVRAAEHTAERQACPHNLLTVCFPAPVVPQPALPTSCVPVRGSRSRAEACPSAAQPCLLPAACYSPPHLLSPSLPPRALTAVPTAHHVLPTPAGIVDKPGLDLKQITREEVRL